MYHKLQSLLVAKFPQARKDGLNQLARSLSLQVENEDEATALVEKFSAEKVTNFIKEWRSEMDSEISKSNKSFEENLKSKFNLTPKNDNEPNPTPQPTDMASVIQQAIAQAVAPLQNQIQSLQAGKTAEVRKSSFEDVLKDMPTSIKNSYLKNFEKMNFQTDEDFNAFLAETKNDMQEITQSFQNKGLLNFPRPQGGNQATQKQVVNDIEQWAKAGANSAN